MSSEYRAEGCAQTERKRDSARRAPSPAALILFLMFLFIAPG